MFDDDSPPAPSRPAARLLDELESIKGALGDGLDANNAVPVDIPLLDDMVIHNLQDNAKLLNIGQIFDEHGATEADTAIEQPMTFPRFTLDVAISEDDAAVSSQPIAATPAAKPRVRPDYSREVLIQELIDEFIPQIEAELHRRLGQLDDISLRRLKEPK